MQRAVLSVSYVPVMVESQLISPLAGIRLHRRFLSGDFCFEAGGNIALKAFWISLMSFLVCGNALTATILFDLGGGGFFDFRPALYCFFFGSIMLLSGFTAVGCRLFVDPTIPRIPDALR